MPNTPRASTITTTPCANATGCHGSATYPPLLTGDEHTLYMTLAGQDMTKTNTATIGAAPSPMCPVIMFPLQYKIDVFAQAGSGPVAVQVYSKNK